jgi:ribosomal protein S18 acetylase RimI-like enzyme
MSVVIRFAVPADAALIADLSRSTFYETFASQNTKENMDKFMNEQFTRETLMNEVSDPGNIFFLAYEQDLPLGYVKMREKNDPAELLHSNVIEIARIYVDNNAIGKGIGRALLQKCVEVAREKKKEIIWLGVWEQNHKAIDFYTKWGFEKFSTHTFLLGDDLQTDWLMKKEL